MSSIAATSYEVPEPASRRRRVLSIVVQPQSINAEQLDGAVAPVLTRGALFDAVHFMGAPDAIAIVQQILESSSAVRERLDVAVPNAASAITCITFDLATGMHRGHSLDGRVLETTVISREQQYSLAQIFRQCGGLVEAPSGIHYVKPSQKHATAFLRTANVLETSANIYTIGFWLLPYIALRTTERIFVDTSGISAVATTLAYEALRLGLTTALPLIESHNSYDGLTQAQIDDPERSLFLVSASTSGELRAKIVSLGVNPDRIVTLYFLGDRTDNAGQVLCNLTSRLEFPEGLPALTSSLADNCPYCRNHSYPVNLSGDQFSLEPRHVREVLIQLQDLPAQQKIIIDQFAGLRLFKVWRTVGEREFEIYLDVSALFVDPAMPQETRDQVTLSRLQDRWASLVRRGTTLHTRRIVYTNYPYSDQLALAAHALARQRETASAIPLVSSTELKDSSIDADSAALVITACLDDAHEVMAINRDLRVVQPQGNATYITPIVRTASKTERDRIISSLTFGEHGRDTFNLYRACDIDLPHCRDNHSWKNELASLYAVREWSDRNDAMLPDEITARIAMLQRAPAQGLTDELFWPGPNNKALSARADFTLITSDGGTRRLTQADVFVAVCAILHELRTRHKGERRLTYTSYDQAVLSPDNFQRLNDGIIQASLLRAAEPHELCFMHCDRALSRRMESEVLLQIEGYANGGAEAVVEFFIALLTGRLTLPTEHLRNVCSKAFKDKTLPLVVRHLARFMLD
jgi:hypothetical protein